MSKKKLLRSLCNCFSSFNIHYLHNSFGFLPLSSLSTSSVTGGKRGIIQPNINSYLSIQQFYMGIPNFLSKIAPIASHINFKLFGELLQGFHNTQILDLIQ
jgi:hypothetical protein